MTRIKRGVMANKRRKKVIKKAKGYLNARSKKYKAAKEALMKAGVYSYRDRKVKKRTMRGLWLIRLNAGVRKYGLNYSKFIHALKLSNVELDRKVLSQIAVENPKIFKNIVEKAKTEVK
ncbi:MAG: 50S ribosomal protein L20 [Candidatus Pacebacteria bacterium]|nr:50S ribosomal protein L20 [Candidatus Paceibacterota bacterium]